MLRQGDLIGDWVVEDQLGAGGMGAVWRCHSRHAPRMKVAVKVLVGGEAAELRREAAALAAHSPPGVVSGSAPGDDPDRGCLFLAMELVSGQTLRKAIGQGALPASQVRQLALGVLDALTYIHGQGVCHRDLKPANIMLRPDGKPVLVDFGIARESSSRSPTGEVLGTPSYLAPERLQPGEVDPARVDLYALGVSLFEALTARPAFVTARDLSPQQRAFRIIEMKRTQPALDPGSSVVPELRALVLALTQPDPRQRPASATAAVALLTPPAVVEHTVRVPEPKPSRSLILPVAVLLSVVGVAVGAATFRGLSRMGGAGVVVPEVVVPDVPEVVAPAVLAGPVWDQLTLPSSDELRRTDSVLLLGVPGGEVDTLSAAVGAGLVADGWRLSRDASSGQTSVTVYVRSGRSLGVLVSVENGVAFVLMEDLDTIPDGESQIGPIAQ